MPDQADQLRHWIHAAPAAARAATEGLPLVAVTGSRAGVGATTVAVNLAAALADRNQRVLIVDAADAGSNIAEIAGVRSQGGFSLADVMEGKCKIAEAVLQGPVGTSLLAAGGREAARRDCEFRRNSPTWRKRLMGELQSLRDDFDVMVIDTGAGLSPLARRLWLRAPLVLLVTTCDDAAVMDAYAAVKLHTTGAGDASCSNVRVLVNQPENDRAAENAHQRLSHCCRRFLRQSVAALPPLPRFDERENASEGLSPRVWESPNTRFGHAALWLGRAVCDVFEEKGLGSGVWGL